MARTTVDLERPLLRKLRTISAQEHVAFKDLLAEILSLGLKARGKGEKTADRWTFPSRKVGLKIDLEDKELVYRALEGL